MSQHYKKEFFKFLFRDKLELMCFVWILARAEIGETLNEGIESYRKYWNIHCDLLPTESMRVTYYRMLEESKQPELRQALNGATNSK